MESGARACTMLLDSSWRETKEQEFLGEVKLSRNLPGAVSCEIERRKEGGGGRT